MLEDIRVSILGRNELVREGLKRILVDQSFNVESTVIDSTALITEINGKDVPHLIIVDACSDTVSFDMCRILHDKYPTSNIVLTADAYSIKLVARAIAAVVGGYSVKASSVKP